MGPLGMRRAERTSMTMPSYRDGPRAWLCVEHDACREFSNLQARRAKARWEHDFSCLCGMPRAWRAVDSLRGGLNTIGATTLKKSALNDSWGRSRWDRSRRGFGDWEGLRAKLAVGARFYGRSQPMMASLRIGTPR